MASTPSTSSLSKIFFPLKSSSETFVSQSSDTGVNFEGRVYKVIDKLNCAVNWLRLYNAGVSVFVGVSYFFEKGASLTEYSVDSAIHALNAFSSPKSSGIVKTVAMATNVYRLYDIYQKGLDHSSTIPYAVNVLDIVNHSVSIAMMTWQMTLAYFAKNVEQAPKQL